MQTIVPDSFDRLWAVVVHDSPGGRRLIWSSEHRTWLPEYDFRDGFVATPLGSLTFAPASGEVGAVVPLTERLLRDRICQHCGLADLEDHFVAPDVFGEPSLLCVQMPHPQIVGSSGGNGARKHWGAIDGCSAVRGTFSTASWGEEQIDFGTPLVASHVRDWEWCSRCAGAAGNIAVAADAAGVAPKEYEQDRENALLRRRQANMASRRG